METLACAALMAALLAFSDAAMAAARTAAQCFAQGVLPALLPMMVLGKMLPECTKTEHSLLKQITPFCFGLAAGSPASAQRAAELYAAMPRRRWEQLLCATGVMSPMFLCGTLADWLGGPGVGWRMLAVHWLGAGITALIWPIFSRREACAAAEMPCQPGKRLSLPAAIAQSAQALLGVCGAMMVFSVLAALLKSLLGVLFPVWTAQHEAWIAVVWALLEIGSGSAAVIAAAEAPYALLCALCGFGGLSIWLQNLLFLNAKIRPGRLLCMRALHGAVSYGVVRLIRPF